MTQRDHSVTIIDDLTRFEASCSQRAQLPANSRLQDAGKSPLVWCVACLFCAFLVSLMNKQCVNHDSRIVVLIVVCVCVCVL